MTADASSELRSKHSVGEDFDRLASRFQYGMLVVTTVADGERGGCLVGFHSQCSIEPVQYAVWLSKANQTFRVASRADVFALHFLDQRDRSTAVLFGTETGDDTDKFERCPWHPGHSGVPLLDRCRQRLVGVRVNSHDDGGDHVCFVLDPIATEISDNDLDPLMNADVADLEPGHDA